MRLMLMLLAVLALAGCGGGGAASSGGTASTSGGTTSSIPTTSVPGKTGVALDVSVKRVSARADIRAATAEDVQEILIDFLDRDTLKPIVETTVVKRSAPSVDVTIDVPVGTWILRIQGRTASGDVAGTRFETVITVTEGQTTEAAAELNPVVNLAAIQVNPGPSTILAQGTTGQFTAVGVLSDLTTTTLGVTWTSSNPAVANVSATGLVTALSAGTTVISARSGSITGGSTLTVTPTGVKTLQVTPNPVELSPGLTQQLTATGVFEDDTNQNVTNQATWTSSAPNVAAVSSSGLVTAAAPGQTTVTARVGNVTSTAKIVVKPVLTRIELSPSNVTLPVGTSQTVRATGVFSDNTTQDITNTLTWTSANPGVATVTNTGSVTGVASGNTSVTASSGNVSATTTVRVEPILLTRLAVRPSSASIPKGSGQAFNATGTFSNNSTRDVTQEVTWTSTNVSVATISTANGTRGEATGVNAGSCVIEATLDGISASASVNVTVATLVSISLSPANPSVGSGDLVTFKAFGTFSDGTSLDVTANVTWTTSNTSVALISNAAGTEGQATSTAPGTATITATLGTVTASTGFTTKEPPTPPAPIPSPSPVISVANVLVSHVSGNNATGAGQNTLSAGEQASSADGRYVAFVRNVNAANSPDGDSTKGVFRWDRLTNTCLRVSLVNNTNAVPTSSPDYFGVSISGDGNRVAFVTNQPLVPTDTNHFDAGGPLFGLPDSRDVYVRDVTAGETILVSKDAKGALGFSASPSLSRDGQWTTFCQGSDPVLIWRGQIGGALPGPITGAVPTNSPPYTLDNPKISADGSAIVFSSSYDVTTGTEPGYTSVCLWKSGVGFTKVQGTAAQTPGNNAVNPALSDDGQTVVYTADYEVNAVPLPPDKGDAGTLARAATQAIWRWTGGVADQVSPTTTAACFFAAMSGNARYVTFQCNADPDLGGSAYLPALPQGYVKDLVTGNVGRLSYSPSRTAATAICLSGDGTAIILLTSANDLLPGYTIGAGDVLQIANVVFGGATPPPAPTPPVRLP